MEKYELLPKQLRHEGTCTAEDFVAPKSAPLETVCRVHAVSYVHDLLELKLDEKAVRKIGFPLTKELIAREFCIAGGTIAGALHALEAGIALNIAGGTHHAYPQHGEAFCLLNDQAIAAQYLLDHQLASKILILDLDVHQGNGTAVIFKDNPNVITCSFHGAKNYPFKKEESDIDIPLPDGTTDAQYLDTLRKKLPEILKTHQPDFIFYLCGVDVLASDKLGRLGMTIEGTKARDQFVLETCKENNLPVQCSMGGGYSPEIKTIIEAHANTFRVARALYS
jgi:acetoin utilization deacetylase AcuC-like enzyme